MPESGREETGFARADRNLTELLGELRVALPGVQVLFAFLLVLPFNARFREVTPFQEKVYFATLLVTAGASVFLIAPSVHHRLVFRRQEKEFLVATGNRLAIVGLTMLALSIVGAVLLVTDFILGGVEAAIATGIGVIMLAGVWYGIPLRQRMRG